MIPWADVLYGCDQRWWDKHQHCENFLGEKWSSHAGGSHADQKIETADKYGLNLVSGEAASGFSTDPNKIHYGDNSGFQSLNLAILFGSPYIVMCGFDMRHVDGKAHFFGNHTGDLFQRREYEGFVKKFDKAPAPEGVKIINATPDSAVKCYPMMDFEEAVDNYVNIC